MARLGKWCGRTLGLFKLATRSQHALFEVLLCRRRRKKAQVQHKRDVKGAERGNVAAVHGSYGGPQIHGKKQRFRIREGRIVTYEQQKLGLNAYCDKRWVLEDGIHTEPIKNHI